MIDFFIKEPPYERSEQGKCIAISFLSSIIGLIISYSYGQMKYFSNQKSLRDIIAIISISNIDIVDIPRHIWTTISKYSPNYIDDNTFNYRLAFLGTLSAIAAATVISNSGLCYKFKSLSIFLQKMTLGLAFILGTQVVFILNKYGKLSGLVLIAISIWILAVFYGLGRTSEQLQNELINAKYELEFFKKQKEHVNTLKESSSPVIRFLMCTRKRWYHISCIGIAIAPTVLFIYTIFANSPNLSSYQQIITSGTFIIMCIPAEFYLLYLIQSIQFDLLLPNIHAKSKVSQTATFIILIVFFIIMAIILFMAQCSFLEYSKHPLFAFIIIFTLQLIIYFCITLFPFFRKEMIFQKEKLDYLSYLISKQETIVRTIELMHEKLEPSLPKSENGNNRN